MITATRCIHHSCTPRNASLKRSLTPGLFNGGAQLNTASAPAASVDADALPKELRNHVLALISP